MKNDEFEECGTLFSSAWLAAIESIPSANDRLECFLAITRYGCRGEQYEGDSPLAQMVLTMALPMLRKFRSKALAGKRGGASGKGLCKARFGNKNASKTQSKRKQNATAFLDTCENGNLEETQNAIETQASDKPQTRINKRADGDEQNAKRKQNATKDNNKDKDKDIYKEKIYKKENPTSSQNLNHESFSFESEAFPFSEFWTAYPPSKRKADKARCESNWSKLNRDDRERCLVAVKAWAQSEDWRKQNGDFIPAPLVFLHQRRWEAELPQKASSPANAPYRTPNYAEKVAEMRKQGLDVKGFGNF